MPNPTRKERTDAKPGRQIEKKGANPQQASKPWDGNRLQMWKQTMATNSTTEIQPGSQELIGPGPTGTSCFPKIQELLRLKPRRSIYGHSSLEQAFGIHVSLLVSHCLVLRLKAAEIKAHTHGPMFLLCLRKCNGSTAVW